MRGWQFVCALIGALALGGTCWAQDNVLWRVQSSISATLPPIYAGFSSPFPFIAPPVVAQNNEEMKVDPADVERQQQKEEFLSRLTELASDNKAIIPNSQNIRATARIEGPMGARVLVNNQWMGVGESLFVSQEFSPAAQEILYQLKQLDNEAMLQKKSELWEQYKAAGGAKLKINQISNTFITLKSDKGSGQLIVVPLMIR